MRASGACSFKTASLSFLSSPGTPSEPALSNALTRSLTVAAVSWLTFSDRALSKLPKGNATERGKWMFSGSWLRRLARFLDLPPVEVTLFFTHLLLDSLELQVPLWKSFLMLSFAQRALGCLVTHQQGPLGNLALVTPRPWSSSQGMPRLLQLNSS